MRNDADPGHPAARNSVVVRWSRRLSILAIGTDPGLNRLRMGTAGAVCVAIALAAEFALAEAMHVPGPSVIVFMMMGGMIGMLGSNALTRADAWASVRAAAYFPVALGIGLLAGILAGPYRVLSLAMFVVVMFAAVYIRRFGINYFFSGFLVWIGYFIADFLHAKLNAFPGIMLAIVVATAVVLTLCTTLFRPHPRRTVRRIFRSMDARVRSAAHRCTQVIEAGTDQGERASAVRRLQRSRRQVRETALMSDGWAAHAPALPAGWSAIALRRRMLEAQLNLDRLAAACDVLSRESEEIRRATAAAVTVYASGRGADAVSRSCDRLEQSAGAWGQRPKRYAGYVIAALTALAATPAAPDEAQGQEAEEFEPAAALMLGNLPGSVSVATDVAARGSGWNPLARLRLTTRQAVQVAIAGGLAIVAGSMLSPQRYYWAVIAAFVAFTGTGSRMETFRKSLNRVLGTLVGLFAGILSANLTTGHTLWALGVVVVSIFCGFYLVRISYAYMIFFITIMISQLYGILGMFSDELLLLRLEETAIGATVGIVVALLVTPVSTRDTVAHAAAELLAAVSEALVAAGDRIASPGSVSASRLEGLIFTVDNNLRRLEMVADPLTHQYLWERRPREVRRRLALYTACVSSTRELIAAAAGDRGTVHGEQDARDEPDARETREARDQDARLAQAYRDAAAAARPVADGPPVETEADPASLPALAGTADGETSRSSAHGVVAHHLVRLRDLLGEITDD